MKLLERLASQRRPALVLYGLADRETARCLGPEAEFQGVRVGVRCEGPVAALFGEAMIPKAVDGWIRRRLGKSAVFNVAPVLSAMSSVCPLLPVEPGTRLESLEDLDRLMKTRGEEIRELIDAHAGLLECEVTAEFDPTSADADILSRGPLAHVKPENPAEVDLISYANRQSLAGRRASLFARLRRRLLDVCEDVQVESAPRERSDKAVRRILVRRSLRGQLGKELGALARDVGAGARITLGPFGPPVNFRCLEVRSADLGAVAAARASFGLADSAKRSTMRMAYHRALERVYPGAGSDTARSRRLAELQQQFALLELVAEGQASAKREHDGAVSLDSEALASTLLMRFRARDRALRAA